MAFLEGILNPENTKKSYINAPQYSQQKDFLASKTAQDATKSGTELAQKSRDELTAENMAGVRESGQPTLASGTEQQQRTASALGGADHDELTQALGKRAQRNYTKDFNLMNVNAMKQAEERKVKNMEAAQGLHSTQQQVALQAEHMANQNKMINAQREFNTQKMRNQQNEFHKQQRASALGSILGLVGFGAGAAVGTAAGNPAAGAKIGSQAGGVTGQVAAQ